MGEAIANKATVVLDNDYFSSHSITSFNPLLHCWHSVRQRHAGYQMLGLKSSCNSLRSFISSELKVEEKQLLGSDLVTSQQAFVDPKPPAALTATQKVLHSLMEQDEDGRWGINQAADERGYKAEDMEAVLQNGVYQFDYKGKNFYVYTFRVLFGYNEVEMNVVVWKDETDVAGKTLIADARTWSSALRDQIWVFHGALGGWRKDSNFYRAVESAQADDIVLETNVVDQLYRDTLAFFSNAKLYYDLGVTWKRGILLLGPPGNGKTGMIRVLLQKCKGIPALYVQSAHTNQGEEYGMHSIFSKARQTAPCILVLEDVETLVSGKARSFMLNQLDGIEPNDGILVIATANDVSKLDAAILQRPSRFDAKYIFELPNAGLRRRYAVKWLNDKVGKDKLVFDAEDVGDFDALVDAIVDSTPDWSFAFLKELFMSYLLSIAAKAAQDGTRKPIASVQGLLNNIELLKKQLTLGEVVEGRGTGKGKGKERSDCVQKSRGQGQGD